MHINFTELIADTQLVFKINNQLVSQLDKFKSYADDIEQISYKESMQLIVEMKANLKRIRSGGIYDANFRKINMHPKLNVSFHTVYPEQEEDCASK